MDGHSRRHLRTRPEVTHALFVRAIKSTDLQSLRSEVATSRDSQLFSHHNLEHRNLEFDYLLIADWKYIQIIAMPPRNKGPRGISDIRLNALGSRAA